MRCQVAFKFLKAIILPIEQTIYMYYQEEKKRKFNKKSPIGTLRMTHIR